MRPEVLWKDIPTGKPGNPKVARLVGSRGTHVGVEPTYQAKVEKEEKEERVREAKEKERAREKANVPWLDESWDNKWTTNMR